MSFWKRYTGKRVGTDTIHDAKEPPARTDGVPRNWFLTCWDRFTAWWQRRHWAARISMIAGGALVTLALALTIFISIAMPEVWSVVFGTRPPDDTVIIPNNPSPSPDLVPSGASPVPTPSGGHETTPSPQPGYVRREGVYTFLLAGVNEGLTDTLMVVTLDTEANTCHVLSIPRDTVVGSAPRTIKKINSAYSQQRNVDEPGIAQMKKEIATLIGFQPQYTAVVDYNAFKELIRAIEYVEFYVPHDMYVVGEGINLKKGQQRLYPDQALQFVRFRVNYYGRDENGKDIYGWGWDDYGRMEAQQALLAAAAKKALDNWGKILDYIDIAQKNIKVNDMDWGNVRWFAEEISKIGMDNVIFKTLPTYSVKRPAELSGEYYEVVKAEEALVMLNETINPFTAPIGPEILEYTILTER